MNLNRNNHQGIAKAVYEKENDRKVMYDYRASDRKCIDLSSNIKMSLSKDAMVWYIWAWVEGQDDPYVKVVPAFSLKAHTIAEILKAQPWVYL